MVTALKNKVNWCEMAGKERKKHGSGEVRKVRTSKNVRIKLQIHKHAMLNCNRVPRPYIYSSEQM